MDLTAEPLTEEQQRVVDHAGGPARVVGGAGTGKTTALVARYLRLLDRHPPSALLVLCANRAAATGFRDAVLPRLAGGFDALPVTTVFGLAFDLVTRHDGPVCLLGSRAQRDTVRRLLRDEDPAAWPTLGAWLGRPAFVDAVAGAVLERQRHPGGLRGPNAEPGPWAELDGFAGRYRAHLAACGHVDTAGLLARATDLLAEQGGAAYAAVLVDDADLLDGPAATLATHLGRTWSSPARPEPGRRLRRGPSCA